MFNRKEKRAPLIALPPALMGLIVLLALIHLGRFLFLSPWQDETLLLTFSFIPARYAVLLMGETFPGALPAAVWTPFTYAFLHGDAMHLLLNGLWLAIFGTMLIRRLGAVRFFLFSAGAVAAGAFLHLLVYWGAFAPVIGASSAIAAHMAAISRFAFQPGGPLSGGYAPHGRGFHARALPLKELIRDQRVLVFLGLWFGLNLLFGLGGITLGGAGGSVAWQAHIGGFLFGLLAFSLFDKAPPAPRLVRRPW